MLGAFWWGSWNFGDLQVGKDFRILCFKTCFRKPIKVCVFFSNKAIRKIMQNYTKLSSKRSWHLLFFNKFWKCLVLIFQNCLRYVQNLSFLLFLWWCFFREERIAFNFQNLHQYKLKKISWVGSTICRHLCKPLNRTHHENLSLS